MGTHSIHLFNSSYISTPSNARHLSEALALSFSLSLLTISLSRQWYLSLCCDSLSLSLSHSQHQGIIMDFGPQEVFFVFFLFFGFFFPNWAYKSPVNLFVFTQRLDMRNELQKGTSAFGSKTPSQAYLLPCCV